MTKHGYADNLPLSYLCLKCTSKTIGQIVPKIMPSLSEDQRHPVMFSDIWTKTWALTKADQKGVAEKSVLFYHLRSFNITICHWLLLPFSGVQVSPDFIVKSGDLSRSPDSSPLTREENFPILLKNSSCQVKIQFNRRDYVIFSHCN